MAEPIQYDEGADVLTPDREKQKVKPPPLYMCVMVNDDYTTMEFVVRILMSHFSKSEEEAAQITMDVHQKGKGIAGIYSKDVADTKASIVNAFAQQEEFPFLIQVEPQGDDS